MAGLALLATAALTRPAVTLGSNPVAEFVQLANPPSEVKTLTEVAEVDTDKGKITISFFPDKAPNHVLNFKSLARAGFYNGVRFHRCIPGFMVQTGDPNSKDLTKFDAWGQGGNIVDGVEKTLKAEFNDIKHERGIVSMARAADPDSASSQFFIVTSDSLFLDHQYTSFGKVTSGMDAVDAIVQTGSSFNNGAVVPEKAVVVKSVKIVTASTTKN